MGKKLLLLVNIFILLSIQVGFCGALTIPKSQPAAQLPSFKNKIVSRSDAPAQLNQLRWAIHKDSVEGTSSMRLVLDVSGRVEIDKDYVTSPSPRIIVKIKGAQIGSIAETMKLSGDIVDKISFSTVDAQTMQMVIDLPNEIADSDFKVFTLPSNQQAEKPFRIVVDVNKGTPPPDFSFTPGLKNKIIVLDPGHGGSDPGAIGLNKTTEKSVTLAVAQKVKFMLEKFGATVIMTRSDDRDVYAPNDTAVEELSARIAIAKRNKADIFVSLHANAFNDRSVGGTSTYYYPKTYYDAMLAKAIQTNIMDNQKLQDRGINQANFYVVKRSLMPAVLVEMAFISNPNEEKLLNSASFQQQVAQGVVQGLDQFFLQASKQEGSRR